jgi:MraZ protein
VVFCGGTGLAFHSPYAGITALSLDAKGRMMVPARYRETLLAESSGALALIESDDGCLLLMARRFWEARIAGFEGGDMDTEQRRFWLGLSDTPEMDAQGRLLINPVLREGAGIARDVILLGVGGHFEIWDATSLNTHKQAVRARKRGGA